MAMRAHFFVLAGKRSVNQMCAFGRPGTYILILSSLYILYSLLNLYLHTLFSYCILSYALSATQL